MPSSTAPVNISDARKSSRPGGDRSEQGADALRLDDRGVVLLFGRREGAAQIARGIAFRPPRRHGVPKDLTAILHRPVRRFLRAPALYPAQHGE